MKANGAPEKIYLNPLLMEDGESIVRNCTFERQSVSQLKYTRADAFIEKAIAWWENNLQGVVGGSIYIEDFRNYMKGE